jgi:endo-1,4-beta-xylanase
MKFERVHPGPVSYNFEPADSLVAFAQSHRMAVRGHTLVWHHQFPSWLTSGGYSFVELSLILADHVYTVVKHFARQVYAGDVVNEAFNDDGSLRSTLWSDSPGIGLKGAAYIEQALQWAHAADPDALLFYNDFNAEPVNAKSDAIYRMARDFLSRGMPLNGIGLQMHLSVGPLPLDKIDENIGRLEDLGLQVQITELDVGLPVDAGG